MPIPSRWGVTPEECSRTFPGDRFTQPSYTAYYRGITIRASPETVFRWLCQMKAAPYSYDWLDNLGRQSPLEICGENFLKILLSNGLPNSLGELVRQRRADLG